MSDTLAARQAPHEVLQVIPVLLRSDSGTEHMDDVRGARTDHGV